MPNKKKEGTGPLCRMKGDDTIWEGLKPRSLKELTSWEELDNLSQVFDGPYPTGLLITMKWRYCGKDHGAANGNQESDEEQPMRHLMHI